ncbi:hypothetical protein K461DRAFT_296521 [Myriangium duriaei CBS 260.36]|uniref:Uncharacterized protein n=1 Tax=Myriangium duriaei CBS 260.36 TaxID=1168546 RepID=A0A9P4IUD4_9PEZI|nr:hypothetical protein K461DRAFT_296521 [Myriangium duriaei CBS 260.36]
MSGLPLTQQRHARQSAKSLFDISCQRIAEFIHQDLTDDAWRSLTDHVTKWLNDHGIDYEHERRVQTIAYFIILNELAPVGATHLNVICGGTSQLRRGHAQAQGESHVFTFPIDNATAAIYFEARPPTHWEERLHFISRVILQAFPTYSPHFPVIVLPPRFYPRLTSYSVTNNVLTVSVAAEAFIVHAGATHTDIRFNPYAEMSLRWILECHARPQLVLNWPEGPVSLVPLPLPEKVKHLTLTGSPRGTTTTTGTVITTVYSPSQIDDPSISSTKLRPIAKVIRRLFTTYHTLLIRRHLPVPRPQHDIDSDVAPYIPTPYFPCKVSSKSTSSPSSYLSGPQTMCCYSRRYRIESSGQWSDG